MLTGTACTSSARFCAVTTIFSTVTGPLSAFALLGGAACATIVGVAGGVAVCATIVGAAAVSVIACATTVGAGTFPEGDCSPGGDGSAACVAAANSNRGI